METKTPDNLTRGWFTPTDGFYGIGAWGYTRDGEHWNGWRVPYLTLDDARRVARELNEMETNTGGEQTSLSIIDGESPAWSETWDGKTERHEMATLTVHGVTYYAFGGWSFTWSQVHTEHRTDLDALGPKDRDEWVELTFELLHSWWSAIDTDDAMQLMLSATLDEIIRLAEFVEKHSPYLGDPLPYWEEAHSYASRVDWFEDYRDDYPRLDMERIEGYRAGGGYDYV